MTYAPRHVPNYAVSEAAHYLRMSMSTLGNWTRGWGYPTQDGGEFSDPLICVPDPAQRQLSFANLVEAHVLLAIRQQHHIPMQKVRPSLAYVQKCLEHDRPWEPSGSSTIPSLPVRNPTPLRAAVTRAPLTGFRDCRS